MRLLQRFFITIIFLASPIEILPYTTHHFYRASYMPSEPRFETGLLSSADVQLAGGATRASRNNCGKQQPLVGLLTDNKKLIFSGEEPGLNAHFKLFEANFTFTQNLCNGFFVQAYIPTRLIKLRTAAVAPCKKKISWFLKKKYAFIEKNICCLRKAGLADSVFLLGWTKNYVHTNHLDFIDATIETGVLVPTGRKRKNCSLCSIPFGYNGHYAIPLSIDAAIGGLNWLTFGLHGDALFFFKRRHPLCISRRKVAAQKVTVKPGNLWSVGSYLKADHFAFGLSAGLGFSYVQNNEAKFCFVKKTPKDLTVVDPLLRKWDMFVLHFMTEYDFSCEEWFVGPRIGLFFNWQIAGRNVFKTDILCADFGAELSCSF